MDNVSYLHCQSNEDFEFGDRRIDRRANFMVATMSKRAGKTLPEIFCKKAELQGAYRFLDNDLVTPDAILRPHIEQTIERCKLQKLVGVIQDSSDLDYDYLTSLEGFEPLHPQVEKGFRLHPLLAITESGTSLGVLGALNYTRSINAEPKKRRNALPIEEKESFRWLQGYRIACELAKKAPSVTVVSIADREGDIYECLREAENAEIGQKAHILVRSNHNRCLVDAPNQDINHLEKKLIRSSIQAQGKLKLNEHRSTARTAEVAIRACEILIQAPKTPKKRSLPAVTVNAVLISEIDPPKNAEPIYWLLITTLPINTLDGIHRIAILYSQRWKIEIFFKVLKSGCKIDSPHLQTTGKIENFIALALIVAWKVMLTTYLPREYPDAPCTVIFAEIEWKLAYLDVYGKKKPLPTKVPSLKEAVMLIAMLGGYQKRKEPPGIQTIWKGIAELISMVRGVDLAERFKDLIHNG